jgi:hypothetical protein
VYKGGYHNKLNHPINHLTDHFRIPLNPEDIPHNLVGRFEGSGYSVTRTGLSQFIKTGVFYQIPGKQHQGLNVPVPPVKSSVLFINCRCLGE